MLKEWNPDNLQDAAITSASHLVSIEPNDSVELKKYRAHFKQSPGELFNSVNGQYPQSHRLEVLVSHTARTIKALCDSTKSDVQAVMQHLLRVQNTMGFIEKSPRGKKFSTQSSHNLREYLALVTESGELDFYLHETYPQIQEWIRKIAMAMRQVFINFCQNIQTHSYSREKKLLAMDMTLLHLESALLAEIFPNDGGEEAVVGLIYKELSALRTGIMTTLVSEIYADSSEDDVFQLQQKGLEYYQATENYKWQYVPDFKGLQTSIFMSQHLTMASRELMNSAKGTRRIQLASSLVKAFDVLLPEDFNEGINEDTEYFRPRGSYLRIMPFVDQGREGCIIYYCDGTRALSFVGISSLITQETEHFIQQYPVNSPVLEMPFNTGMYVFPQSVQPIHSLRHAPQSELPGFSDSATSIRKVDRYFNQGFERNTLEAPEFFMRLEDISPLIHIENRDDDIFLFQSTNDMDTLSLSLLAGGEVMEQHDIDATMAHLSLRAHVQDKSVRFAGIRIRPMEKENIQHAEEPITEAIHQNGNAEKEWKKKIREEIGPFTMDSFMSCLENLPSVSSVQFNTKRGKGGEYPLEVHFHSGKIARATTWDTIRTGHENIHWGTFWEIMHTLEIPLQEFYKANVDESSEDARRVDDSEDIVSA